MMRTCLEWAGLLRRREVTSLELTERYLARIRAVDPHYGAFRLVTEELALRQARAADAAFRQGIVLSPLQGVPYAVKDLFDVAGLPTSAGCELLAGRVADQSASVITAMDAAGMVLLGKTNLVQFAHGSLGINTTQGTPRNPWSVEPVIPGGSSSGSAAAVATGQAPIALGTDTSGSVRVPAALCGVVGLKTTAGSLDMEGVYPLSPTLDSIGVLAQAPDDIAALLEVLGAKEGADSRFVRTAHVWRLRTACSSASKMTSAMPCWLVAPGWPNLART